MTLTETNLERYSRNILLPEIGGKGQQKLLNAKVLVIGAGGLGSPIIMYLAALGVGNITIVDHDKVELSNLQRQIIHNTENIGIQKSESAAMFVKKLNPETNIWTTSKPVLESWLRETKDPLNTINETLQNTSEVIKRLPDFPEIMDKANQALTYLASGQIPQHSNSFTALNNKKSEMIAFRNQSIIGILAVVIIGLLVF